MTDIVQTLPEVMSGLYFVCELLSRAHVARCESCDAVVLTLVKLFTSINTAAAYGIKNVVIANKHL